MITEIPIRIISLEENSYHLLVGARFNGSKTGQLIIDTGASKTVFDTNFVSELITDIKKVAEHTSSGINSMIPEAQIGTLPAFNIGKLHIKNYQSVLMDLSHVNKVYQEYTNNEIAGLLGSDFLLNYEAVINYHQKTLSLNFKL